MASRIAGFDWQTTPLGAKSDWSESLRTAVGICLASPVPAFVWWGPDLINIYNDAYAPLLGGRHPAALGAPARKVWAAVWPTIASDVEGALQGTSVVRERIRFFLKRKGFPDEMFFKYTFSPIPDGQGGIGGVFQIATDETARVRAEQEQQQANADTNRRLARWQTAIANMTEGVILPNLDDATENRHPQPESIDLSALLLSRIKETAKQRETRTADDAAQSVESLLKHAKLNEQERDFCKSLGEHFVQEAIDAFQNTKRWGKNYDGSCIAASLAIAMIIVTDL